MDKKSHVSSYLRNVALVPSAIENSKEQKSNLVEFFYGLTDDARLGIHMHYKTPYMIFSIKNEGEQTVFSEICNFSFMTEDPEIGRPQSPILIDKDSFRMGYGGLNSKPDGATYAEVAEVVHSAFSLVNKVSSILSSEETGEKEHIEKLIGDYWHGAIEYKLVTARVKRNEQLAAMELLKPHLIKQGHVELTKDILDNLSNEEYSLDKPLKLVSYALSLSMSDDQEEPSVSSININEANEYSVYCKTSGRKTFYINDSFMSFKEISDKLKNGSFFLYETPLSTGTISVADIAE